ncbi:MAG TPA: glucoamylase family protein [Verrucomicrobiae bacterium]|nr:glucoamylase family protein [Verrucomicrobiae bacterium]
MEWREAMDSRTDDQPLRGELLSTDLLKQFAHTLAQNRRVENRQDGPNLLLPRLTENGKILHDYNQKTLQAEKTRRITPAAEWLLDNYHLIEEQIRMARRHLPVGFNRELPQLTNGTRAGFPRVYEIAVELVSHTDGRIDAAHLASFVAGYQEVAPLKMGELWAVPIMLRLALIENLRRVAVLLGAARQERDEADRWADQILEVAETNPPNVIVVVGEMAKHHPALTRAFVTEFLRRMQEKSPPVKLATSWVEERLAADGQVVAQLVQSESQHQATTQVSVGNCIGSLRFLDSMDWQEFVEEQSVVEQKLRTDPAGVYVKMDFATRDLYRHTVERIARRSKMSELEVAACAVELAQKDDGRGGKGPVHVGFYLAGSKGVKILERAASMKLSLWQFPRRVAANHPLFFYLGGIVAVTAAVLLFLWRWLPVQQVSPWVWWAMMVLAAVCASQLAVSVINWLAMLLVGPSQLPRLDFSEGIPVTYATLVAVPTMLTNEETIEGLLESLEVRYLANCDQNVYFALLTDFRDAAQEHQAGDDDLLQRAADGILSLNKKYQTDRPSIFYLFHRPRRWNGQEKIWMGYERKRGKLSDLNRFLRDGDAKYFSKIVGDVARLPHIKYVITLDSDTQLPREAARQLAATMAHPLNCPVYDEQRGLIVEGYSILQPRVAVSLPSASKSHFVKLFSGDPGLDPYTRTVSDVFQDVFQEGSFIGKGIYDVDAFSQSVEGKFPENRILSHDLLEGCYARSGLVSDVQLFEEFPARYHSDTRRRHRWMRGDWQIMAWLLPRLPGVDIRRVRNPLTGLSRWKIFDNLRRTLVPLALVFLLVTGWVFFPDKAVAWSLFVTALVGLPFVLAVGTEFIRQPKERTFSSHLAIVGSTALRQLCQVLLTLVFLPYDVVVSLDAVMRTLWRLSFTRRNLLEWQTSSEVEQRDGGGLKQFFATMWCAPMLAVAVGVALFIFDKPAGPVSVPFLMFWFLSPAVAWWISLPLKEKRLEISAGQTAQLHKLARKTWAYFETFMGPDDHWLPPDNFQEYPHAVLATRTSPTNIGLAMLGALSAYDFGYLSMRELVERLARTLDTLEKVERYQGHLYNWYDTRTLKPLLPLYISTVDNGNFSGLLLTLHSGLLDVVDQDWSMKRPVMGLRATLGVMQELPANSRQTAVMGEMHKLLHPIPSKLSDFVNLLDRLIVLATELTESKSEFENWRRIFEKNCREHRDEITKNYPWILLQAELGRHAPSDATGHLERLLTALDRPPSLREIAEQSESWLAKIEKLQEAARGKPGQAEVAGHLAKMEAALVVAGQNAQARLNEMEEVGRRCDALARMDFKLLYDPARELFSIGYNVNLHRLDASYYDLLASEARLGSFVAIALGQVSQSHWFRLGRLLTTAGGKPALISWSGSMFEYLMPMLVMPSYDKTLLDLTCKSAVARQIEYGKQTRLPWGISESGYNVRDTNANYQYRAFGVPGLGFKRGLAEDLVIAPYASVMALMVAPEECCKNFELLNRENAAGKYGFYEALDYTPSRVPNGQTHAVVRSFMAHHQGMSLLALASLLLDRQMQRRFNANPIFQAADLLLHERVPKETPLLYPHENEAEQGRESITTESNLRVFTDPNAGPPEVHLLSNGHYHVMITSAGGGYSRWNNFAITRWREDPTRDCWGTFFYLRDTGTGKLWSTGHQPTLQAAPGYEAIFSQGRAEFRSRVEDIDAHTEISVSPENDVEVRRVTLTNHSDEVRTIEVTSYAEVILNTAAADLAHPAFSNLFVQTQILQPQRAIVCSRRARTAHEAMPWMCHLMLVRGTESGTISFETDRAQFIGRGGSLNLPAAVNGTPNLSNSQGSVIDPIVAIRRTVRLEPKESASVTLVCGIAPTQVEIMGLVEKYQDQSIADRCFELAWTHGLIVLRHLNTTESEAQLYGRLTSALLYSSLTRRANSSVLLRNQRGQRSLWTFGVSGDIPIVLIYSSNVQHIDLVRQMVQAHAYWRLKGLAVDLVILNEDDSVYRAALHDQIINVIAANNETQLIDKPGGIFVRRKDQLTPEDRTLFETVARIVLNDDQGTLVEQLQRRTRPELTPAPLRIRVRPAVEQPIVLPERELVFANGTGGFTPDGREYVITLQPGETTPMPWVNVLANPNFGTLVSESGGSYTWSENSHEFRLTPWHNDPVGDTSGEAFYIRDELSGKFWSPTPLPARGETAYVSRHGFGYSVFEHVENGIESEVSIYVATADPVKLIVFKLYNRSERSRRLSLTGYWELVMGELRAKNAPQIATEIDSQTGALVARNSYNTDFEGRIVFVTSSELIQSFTADRTEFLGRNGLLGNPAALQRVRLSGKTGIGLDPCAVLQAPIELEPGQEREIVFVLGAGQNLEAARNLARKFQNLQTCREELQRVWDFWKQTLGAVQVETPDASLNMLANGWLLYQTISCRLWARTGFYQSGGAFGFRDQLQDAMTLVHTRRELLREQLLRAAARQFREGDVQHWWHPPQGRGVRTHFSDDYLWLPYAACRYVACVGDTGVLDSEVPFLESRLLRPEEEANYDLPQQSSESATLYEHCVRAVKYGLKFGEHGLPLMGCGDWNDGMNLVGEKGKGESVWLAFFLYDVLKQFAILANLHGDKTFAQECEAQAKTLAENIEKNAWDGQWYRRAYFDNGEPLGSATNPECQIDSIPQSWAVLSGAGSPERIRTAMDAVAHRLVRREAGLIQLFDPPFDKSHLEPGYIKGYVPGVRENGGQYTHAAIWTVMAFARAGETTRAWELFALINPILHARTPEEVSRYKTEPYVVAADVYSVAPHTGRGGWTWYTGSAGWMYRLITETLLGLSIEVDTLRFTPRVPADWKSFKLHYRYRRTAYHINCVNASGTWKGSPKISIDGTEQTGDVLKLTDDQREHAVVVNF